MIYGYHIDFVDEPGLNFTPKLAACEKTLLVQPSSIPKFEIITEDIPHSLQQVRYGLHLPLAQTKGGNIEWMMQIKNVLTLVWFPDKRIIGYQKEEGYTPERLRFWVYHTFLPLLFQMNRIYHILHVGSVEVAGRPILFSAPSFGGKSTLTDYFIRRGHTMLSDDALGIEKRGEEYYAIASYPFHRPYREPEVLGYPAQNFATEAKPLHRVYILNKSDMAEEISIREIKGIEKFKALYLSSFGAYEHMKEERYRFFTQMAKKFRSMRLPIPIIWRDYPKFMKRSSHTKKPNRVNEFCN